MKTFKQHFLMLLLITSGVLILSTPMVYLQIYHSQQIHSASEFVRQNCLGFTVFRLLLITGFFAVWPVVVRHLSRKHKWTQAKINFWLTQRFRVVGWMLIIEFMVCQNLLFKLF